MKLASQPLREPPAFLRHKTTRRGHYELFEAGTAHSFDTLLWNGVSEVPEFTRGSLVIERPDGKRVTPHLGSELLDGVGPGAGPSNRVRSREDVSDSASSRARERPAPVVRKALRGWIEVRLQEAFPDPFAHPLHSPGGAPSSMTG